MICLPPLATAILVQTENQAVFVLEFAGYGFAQGRRTGWRRVERFAAFRRFISGIDNMGRGGKVRLAQAEVNDVDALGHQCLGGQRRDH